MLNELVLYTRHVQTVLGTSNCVSLWMANAPLAYVVVAHASRPRRHVASIFIPDPLRSQPHVHGVARFATRYRISAQARAIKDNEAWI